MDTRTPYFYVIRFKPTGQRYAGSKWGRGCHPSDLMTEGGYCTSSPAVKRLIASHGLDAFEVLETKTEAECRMDVRLFESKFLQENDCAASPEWINSHNNETGMNWGTPEFERAMLKTHGVANPSESYEIRAKKAATWLEKYGVVHPAKSDVVKSKKRETLMKIYGVENLNQVPEFRDKKDATCMERYGFANPLFSKSVQEKRKATMLARYGVESYTLTEEFKAKRKAALEAKKQERKAA